jgi:3-methyladenine DNA glycosylase AlkD
MSRYTKSIMDTLAALGNPDRAVHEKAYLKSDLAFLGASVPAIAKAAKQFTRTHQEMAADDVVDLTNDLWSLGVHEARMFAIDLLELRVADLRQEDLPRIEGLLRDSRTWAYVDSLAASVVGPLVVTYPALNATMDQWARDHDFWVRRSAMLALLLPIRRGGGDLPRFLRYADAMLDEKEFFIRKAIGWVLRETAKTRPEAVYEWLLPRVGRVSGVTLREAVRYLPTERSRELVEAYRSKGARQV